MASFPPHSWDGTQAPCPADLPRCTSRVLPGPGPQDLAVRPGPGQPTDSSGGHAGPPGAAGMQRAGCWALGVRDQASIFQSPERSRTLPRVTQQVRQELVLDPELSLAHLPSSPCTPLALGLSPNPTVLRSVWCAPSSCASIRPWPARVPGAQLAHPVLRQAPNHSLKHPRGISWLSSEAQGQPPGQLPIGKMGGIR